MNDDSKSGFGGLRNSKKTAKISLAVCGFL
jgi:hypothetical protein